MRSEHEHHYGLGMDALRSSHALATRTSLWFGHGCSGYRMLLEQEACYDFAAHPESQVCIFCVFTLRRS